MAHPLEQQIALVRRRAWLLLALYAVSWTLGIVLSAILVFGLVDFLIRFQDHGVRLIGSLAVLGVALWAIYRFLIQGLAQAHLGDVQIARRIEHRFPSLTDRLASALQFLQQSELEPQAGSAALRRSVILQTEADLAGLDVRQVFEPAPARRAAALCGAVALIAVLFAALAPANTRIALARLVKPFGGDTWPRFYTVEFRSPPQRLATGQTFEVEVLGGGARRVPEVVHIHYRYQTGDNSFVEESEPMKWLNGALVARKENVQRPFSYRATGGDDLAMPWIDLEVLEAPRITQARWTLYPPAYSGLPTETSDVHLLALRGTRAALAASVTKPIVRATLMLESGESIPLAVADDGLSVSLASDAQPGLEIARAGQYWIELEDRQGLLGGADERWEIRAITDLEPTVTIEQPATNSYVTARGEVPLTIAVKDDLAIHDITLHYSRSEQTEVEDFVIPLFRAADQVPRRTESGLLHSGKLGESQVVNHRWQLSELELPPGSQLTFWATARDYLPQEGRSTPRKISIITPAELEERLAQRQTLIFGELQRALKLQQDARAQTRSLEIQLRGVGSISKGDVDHAQSAELNQRQVARTLTSPSEGIPSQIAEFLAELRSNQVDSPEVERNMAGILNEIERLQQEHLVAVESDLTGFIKAAQASLNQHGQQGSDTAPAAPLEPSLANAGGNQDQVIESLEQMLSELGRWDNYRRFARDVAQLQREQEEIARQTKELAPQTLGREFQNLNEQQQANLRKLAADQAELSRRLEKTQQQMSDMSRALAESDPIAAATISDGLHQSRESAISDQMRRSGQQLENNQLSQAASQQERIARDLEDLQSILSNRREQELSRLVKQLREAEIELAELRQRQAGLQKKMKAADKIADAAERQRELQRLAREQKELQEQSARLARRLQRLQADAAGRSATGAASKMAGAASQGEQGQSADAQRQGAAAEKDLEEAQQQLAQRRKQAEADLAREQLARLEDALKALLERQQNLITETERLNELRTAAGRLSRAQLSTLADLARQQQELGADTQQQAEKLAQTEVVHLALSGAARKMHDAAELLELRETGTRPQAAQQTARARLERLIAAFENSKQQPANSGQAGGDSSGGASSDGRSDGAMVLTQLKLLKLMQEELNERYDELTSDDQLPSRALRRELTEIAAEQGRLAELTLKLSTPPADNPENDPEKLPDIRQERSPPDGQPDLESLLELNLGGAAPAPREVPPPEPADAPTGEESSS